MSENRWEGKEHQKPQPKMSRQLKYWSAQVLDPHKRGEFTRTMFAAEVHEKRAKEQMRRQKAKTVEADVQEGTVANAT
jgi:hypothetical protein